MNEQVLGYLLTWTVYGTYLQGEQRWWHKRDEGEMPPQPNLWQWHAERLNHPIVLLSDSDRTIVEEAIAEHCEIRRWQLWASSARTNHVHTVITANDQADTKVREQLKANCTRALRQEFIHWIDRPVWSKAGHSDWLRSQDELNRAIEYVMFAQDRKHFDYR